MNGKGLGKAGRFLALGFGFAGSVLGALVVGYYLDDYLGTSPLLLIVLTPAAMVGAVYRLLVVLKRMKNES